MAILVIFTGAGVEKSRYDALKKEVDWQQNPPAGLVFAAAGFDKMGVRVADVWESQQALDEFLNKRLLPAMKKLKVPAPQVEIFPVHDMNVYSGADQYKVKQAVRR
jgi:hypothetical protein